MKTKSILSLALGIFLVLAIASFASAAIWFRFESDPNAVWMEVTEGAQVNLVLTASSHNNVPVSFEKVQAIQGSNTYLLSSWNEPGTQYGSTRVWSKVYTLDTNVLGPGIYILRFSATTNLGTESTDLSFDILPVDTTAPQIWILGNNPETLSLGSVYNDAGATAWDNLDGNLTSQVQATNNVNTAVAGTYSVVYSVSDNAGNSASATRTVNVVAAGDTNAPTITISYPVNAQTYMQAVTNLTFTPNDAEGNLNQCWYSLNGGATNSTPVSCANGVSKTFSGLTPQNGANSWIVYASDTAGNIGSAQVTFTISDLVAPTITAIEPSNNETLDDTDVTLKVSTNEDAVVKYSINGGANVTMTKTTSSSPFKFESALLSLDDDEEYTVVYTATDLMGNVATLTVNFNIDEEVENDEEFDDTVFETEDLDGITIDPAIDLTDDEPAKLTWWQRFINWLARLFGLEEVYPK